MNVHIVWADSDKNIENSAELLRNFCKKNKINLHFFNDTPSCINFFKKNIGINVKCLITSLFGSERHKQ